MSTVHSDLISSFIDHQQQTDSSEEFLYPQYNQQIDLYEVLLKSHSNLSNNTEDLQYSSSSTNTTSTSTVSPAVSSTNPTNNNLTNDNLNLFNFKYTQNPQISTINPRQLSSSASSIDVSYTTNKKHQDYNDNSSVNSGSNGDTEPAKERKQSNWSMNEEFQDAIATWINENQKINHLKKPTINPINVTLSDSPPKFVKTSVTKRRKSDSVVPSTTPLIPTPVSSFTPISPPNPIPSSSSSSTSTIIDNEKPFKCDGCPKAFRRSEHLKRHIRSVHSNIRPFPCKFCDKKFSRSDNLAQHLRTHNKH